MKVGLRCELRCFAHPQVNLLKSTDSRHYELAKNSQFPLNCHQMSQVRQKRKAVLEPLSQFRTSPNLRHLLGNAKTHCWYSERKTLLFNHNFTLTVKDSLFCNLLRLWKLQHIWSNTGSTVINYFSLSNYLYHFLRNNSRLIHVTDNVNWMLCDVKRRLSRHKSVVVDFLIVLSWLH